MGFRGDQRAAVAGGAGGTSRKGAGTVRTILFDLGNTLVSYYEREQFPAILAESLRAAHASLVGDGYRDRSLPEVLARSAGGGRDPEDLTIRPLEERFAEIFGPGAVALGAESLARAARGFVAPLHAPAARYEDTLPALERLAAAGYRIGIVSNLPWGVPSELWQCEIERHGLAERIDFAIFCADVGYRKPAPQIFRAALDRLGVAAHETLFVGDEPVWDVAGAERAGIPAVLIDRTGRHPTHPGPRVTALLPLLERLGVR